VPRGFVVSHAGIKGGGYVAFDPLAFETKVIIGTTPDGGPDSVIRRENHENLAKANLRQTFSIVRSRFSCKISSSHQKTFQYW
jgi:hypothetical protein